MNDFIKSHLEPVIRRYDAQLVSMWCDMYSGHSIGDNIKYFARNSKMILFVIDWENDEDLRQSWDLFYDLVEKSRIVLLSTFKNLKKVDHPQIRALAKGGQSITFPKMLFSEKLVYSLSLGVAPHAQPSEVEHLRLVDTVVHKDMLVYIVYEEEDRDLVLTEIFTIMTKIDISYIHEEDFCPGHPRLANIQSAIERADHTLLVLSSESVNDEELGCIFRLTHEKSLRENTNYLIVITKGQLDISLVENESLRSYLKSRVCLDVDNISESKLYMDLQMISLEG